MKTLAALLAKAKTHTNKAIKTAGLATMLGLSTMAVKGQPVLPTQARGFLIEAGTTFRPDGDPTHPVVGANLEARITGTNTGFHATTKDIGFWYHYDIPIAADPNNLFDRTANHPDGKLHIAYEQGQIRFTIESEKDVRSGTLYNIAGQEIKDLAFFQVKAGTFQAVWQPHTSTPRELIIFKDEQGRAAKITPWAMNAGETRHQDIDLEAQIAKAKKGTSNEEGTVDYTLTFTHQDYETLVVEVTFQTANINQINLEMMPVTPRKYGNVRVGINTTGGAYLPGMIVAQALDEPYPYEHTGIIAGEPPVYDFENIPIDPNDGVTTLGLAVVPTSIPFDTLYTTLDITEGNNPFASLVVNPTIVLQGKRLQGKVLLGQTNGQYANHYVMFIRDEAGDLEHQLFVTGEEYLTPKLQEGENYTISVFFPSNDDWNRNTQYYGIKRAPVTIEEVEGNFITPEDLANQTDTIQTLNMRLPPIFMQVPNTDEKVETTAEWIIDMEGGSYNASYWDDGKEKVYLADNVDTVAYNNALDAIENYFGIRLVEERVNEPLTGDERGVNVRMNPDQGPFTTLTYRDGGHIRTNINTSRGINVIMKERFGRWYEFNDVTTRTPSLMNDIGSSPTKEDRAIMADYFKQQEATNNGDATYEYYYIQKTTDGGF